MKRIIHVTNPDGKMIPCNNMNDVFLLLNGKIDYTILRNLNKEYKDTEPKPFKKYTFIPFKKEIQGYTFEKVRMVATTNKWFKITAKGGWQE